MGHLFFLSPLHPSIRLFLYNLLNLLISKNWPLKNQGVILY